MNNFETALRLPRDGSRRDFMRTALLAAGIVALGPFGRRASEALGAPRSNFKRVVVINMNGGCDTLNMVCPVALQSYYDRRPNIAIPAASALALNGVSGAYKLHPSMPKLAALWNSGDALAVQQVGYPGADLSHFVSQDIFSYGVRNGFTSLGIKKSGWIARFADLYAATPLGAVSIGRGKPLDFTGGLVRGLTVQNLAGFKVYVQNGSIARLDTVKALIHDAPVAGLTYEAKEALKAAYDLADSVQQALVDHNTYLSGAGIAWPNSGIANNLKDIAALIHGGFDTRIFYTGFDGFDTHAVQSSVMQTLLGQLDGALGAFSDEMKALGVWNDVVVVINTEFGRRSFSNGSGTDHGAAYAEIVAGGSVNGGQSYGPNFSNSDLTNVSGYLPYEIDFRSIYKEILRDHMGVDPAPVFPETQEKNHDLGIC
jgi:uncharacterized protein (DUF1501 family)